MVLQGVSADSVRRAVGEARLDETGRATFAGLVARLYRHVFGAAPCDEPAYLEFGAAADGLREHVVPN